MKQKMIESGNAVEVSRSISCCVCE